MYIFVSSSKKIVPPFVNNAVVMLNVEFFIKTIFLRFLKFFVLKFKLLSVNTFG